MRKIVAGLHISLDGVVEAPEKWSFAYASAEVGQAIGARIAAADAMLLGRVTYQTFADAFSGADNPMASGMNNVAKFVVSRTLESADWQNSTLISGNLVEEITSLKARPGKNINVSGSTTLVRWLLAEGLLDELALFVCPIVLGSGQRLFDSAGGQVPLKLVGSEAFSTGVLHLTYQPA
ncbi:dihydrofolate reductase family protein [Streptomyces beijiangensis]|uniref:Dihydrofolate reductase family protein n=1 Tax=Streptomyces beijiangensis TaxID=163361 RepID=A0A939F7J0_9ACTN|nr:dihydrofolate reductase family protein [Streptomyces beijiangensis]MBO0513038.1 dihydrofolate reductase family protein [Streptomyces beijiangensis]